MLLALNFIGQIVLATSNSELVQINIEIENDGENKEVENEKEADKLTHRQELLTSRDYQGISSNKTYHFYNWSSPTIETVSPPPELV